MTMIKRDKKFIGKVFAVISMTMAFGLAASVSLRAQQRTSAPPPPSPPPSRTDVYNQDMKVRGYEIDRDRLAKRDPQAVMAEVNEDLQRLSAINEEMTLKNSANTTPDYKYVAETTTEVKKRATRLKANLASLPAPGRGEKQRDLKDPAKSSFNESLSMLNDLIGGFVHNPIFSDAGAVDPQLAAKARRDLEDVITLSDKVRKSAEKLQKSADKSK